MPAETHAEFLIRHGWVLVDTRKQGCFMKKIWRKGGITLGQKKALKRQEAHNLFRKPFWKKEDTK